MSALGMAVVFLERSVESQANSSGKIPPVDETESSSRV